VKGGGAEAERLGEGARGIGVGLNEDQVEALIDYLDRLYLWNDSAGLTRIDRGDAVRLHLLDALTIVPALAGATEILDLGTGAGVPGIPLAIAVPGLRVTLVETRRRKCSFLAETIGGLGLVDCTVMEEDAHVLAASGRRWEVVTGRAFLAPRGLLELGSRLLGPAGRVVVMGGPGLDMAELATVEPMRAVYERELVLPGGSERRTVVAFERGR